MTADSILADEQIDIDKIETKSSPELPSVHIINIIPSHNIPDLQEFDEINELQVVIERKLTEPVQSPETGNSDEKNKSDSASLENEKSENKKERKELLSDNYDSLSTNILNNNQGEMNDIIVEIEESPKKSLLNNTEEDIILLGIEKKPTAEDVTLELVQKFAIDKSFIQQALYEEQTSHININTFFSSEYSSKYLLEEFPPLKEAYLKYVPTKMNAYTFWIKFMIYVYQDFERQNSEVVKVDYHSLNRYIVSATLSFVKVFFVIAILSHYNAPKFLYLYPALWFVFGILIILRAIQVQRKNNRIAAKLKEEINDGVELKEMESV